MRKKEEPKISNENTEFFEALRLLEKEKGIPMEFMFERISAAIVVAVKRGYNGNDDVVVNMDPNKNQFEVFLRKEVVDDTLPEGKTLDPDRQIFLSDARKLDPTVGAGDKVSIKLETKQFGRIGAQAAKHVIRQGIREVERGQVMQEFQNRNQELVSAVVERIDPRTGAASLTIGKAEAILPKTEQVGAESLKEGDHIKVYVVDVKDTEKGPRAMPQTVEAINHAKAAGVSIIVAINKMDKPGANPDLVKQQLTEYELVPEEWGGDVSCIPVSAVTKQGINDLLEMIALVADMKELKANPDRAAKGTVIEARLDRGKGPIATVLVQNGTLHSGDIIVAGTSVGRVRAMTDHLGNKVEVAGPSVPVEIIGLDDVPTGGDVFNVVSDERLARELVEQRKTAQKEEQFNSQTKVTLDNLFDQMQQGEIKELKIIVKADVQGSVEAVRQSLEKLSGDEVRVNVIHGAVGAISESDVMLAAASNAVIVGFNVRPDPVAAENAKRDGVDMRLYRIIYDCIEEIQSAMKGMLAPKFREIALGRAECRQVYKVTNVGTIAGCYILDGKITRAAQIRIVRDGIVVADDKIASLRRFKDDVKEVAQGYECGIGLERFNDLKEGDIFEGYLMEEYRED